MGVTRGGDFLMSGTATSGIIQSVYDNRANSNLGYIYYSAAGASAIVDVLASHDTTAWMVVVSMTAITGAIGNTAQVAAFYPYVAARARLIYSGGAGTGQPLVHFTPGIT